MQCQQPLFGIGYPAPGQCPPVYPFNGASDIIGEGEVTAVTYPDGTIQYYFLPVRWNGSDYFAKRWPPYPFSDPYCNAYNRQSSGAWIITKISNTISPVFSHCFQRTNPDPFPKPCFNYDCNVNIAPGYQLKFHNDCCTSTTDLQYFCPTVWKPIAVATPRTASVQVETPADTPCHIVGSNVPRNYAECACSITKEYNNKRVQCQCKQVEKKPSSRMSIDKSKTSSSSCNIKISKCKKKKLKKSCSSCSLCYESTKVSKKRRKLVCGCDSQRNAIKETATSDQKQSANEGSETICECASLNIKDDDSRKLSKKKKSQMDCYCDAQSIADKTVVTYTDQASSVKEVEGQTQTERSLDCSCSTLDVKRATVSKLWIPKRISSRNQTRDVRPLSSEKIIGVYGTSSSESNRSSCSCRTSRESFK